MHGYVSMTVCRLAFLHSDAVTALQWIRAHYRTAGASREGGPAVSLVHIGFPTPFTTRSPKETNNSSDMHTVHDKPQFMVQARFHATRTT